jgi:hypothetical protein
MITKKTHHDLPDYSFLVDRQYFQFERFSHSVCLLTFGYYDESGKLCYIYHTLINGNFTRRFTNYAMVLDYLRNFAQ